jgi:hypothetical protein
MLLVTGNGFAVRRSEYANHGPLAARSVDSAVCATVPIASNSSALATSPQGRDNSDAYFLIFGARRLDRKLFLTSSLAAFS